jgi:rubrerythrin
MTVDADTASALEEALDDEYRARATYRKVIETFGPVRPFTNIVEAEERHIDALLRQFARLDLTPPVDPWTGRVVAPASLKVACTAGVAAEIENGAMYTRLLARITDPQVREVLRNLQDASQTRHLPAFRRCLGRSK